MQSARSRKTTRSENTNARRGRPRWRDGSVATTVSNPSTPQTPVRRSRSAAPTPRRSQSAAPTPRGSPSDFTPTIEDPPNPLYTPTQLNPRSPNKRPATQRSSKGRTSKNAVQDKHRNRVSRVKLGRAHYSSHPEEHAFAYSNFEEIALAYSNRGEISNTNSGEMSNSNRGEISDSNRGEISNSNSGEICKQQSPFNENANGLCTANNTGYLH